MDNWLAKMGFVRAKIGLNRQFYQCKPLYVFTYLFISSFFQKMVYLQYPFTKLSPHKVPQIPLN